MSSVESTTLPIGRSVSATACTCQPGGHIRSLRASAIRVRGSSHGYPRRVGSTMVMGMQARWICRPVSHRHRRQSVTTLDGAVGIDRRIADGLDRAAIFSSAAASATASFMASSASVWAVIAASHCGLGVRQRRVRGSRIARCHCCVVGSKRLARPLPLPWWPRSWPRPCIIRRVGVTGLNSCLLSLIHGLVGEGTRSLFGRVGGGTRSRFGRCGSIGSVLRSRLDRGEQNRIRTAFKRAMRRFSNLTVSRSAPACP